ncbi:caspase family protein [Flammeovirga agarivorans]|uniref:Caspase family protein n=1 Tax=Flammeovirga agarivorans TaxID=2726742 RepID=A0A7X8SQB6_9BACT|nr:caspase family protein [Flammeovirga agarivorans]NLR94451.1 caspase family protein [Flammeovirga agarivorans]
MKLITLLLSLLLATQVIVAQDFRKFDAVPHYAKEISFIDEFDDNHNEWTIVKYLEDDVRESKIKNSTYRLTSYDGDESVVEIKSGFGYPYLKDFEIETSIQHEDYQKDHGNGLIWGMSSDGQKGYAISFTQSGYYCIQQMQNGIESYLVDWTYSDLLYEDDYNDLMVRKVGDWYHLFINQNHVYSFPYEPLAEDQDITGFYAEGTSISIDYIKVTSINANKLQTYQPTATTAPKQQVAYQQPKKDTRALVITNPVNNNQQQKAGTYHALIIGVQNYKDNSVKDLQFPLRDANNFKDILVQKYGFKLQNIIFLEDPTRSEVLKSLNTLREHVKHDDNVVIFYAGHGYYDQKVKEGYWLPSDAVAGDDSNWLANANLSTKLKGIDAKHILLISDSCFGGSIFKPSRSAFADAERSITNYYEKRSRKGMTSGTLKTVPDESVFAKYLLKNLQQNKQKYLTASKLFYSFNDAVANNSENAPQFGTLHNVGDEGGQFVFINMLAE